MGVVQHMMTVLEHVDSVARPGSVAPHTATTTGHGATVVSVNGIQLPRGERVVLAAGDNLVLSSPNPRSRPISFVRCPPPRPRLDGVHVTLESSMLRGFMYAINEGLVSRSRAVFCRPVPKP